MTMFAGTKNKLTIALVFCGLGLGQMAASATLTVNHPSDTYDANPGDGICADNDGHCTFRAAIEEANHAPIDTVVIAPGLGPIFLRLGALVVTRSHLCLMGADSSAMIDGRLNPEGTDVLDIRGDDCVVRQLTIANSRRHGIRVRASRVAIGQPGTTTILTGNGRSDTTASAISVEGTAEANIRIAAVWIGVKGNGTIPEPNQSGIRVVRSSGVLIGGSTPDHRNVIGYNLREGILIDSGSSQVTIVGNYIGLDVTGKTTAPNGRDGVAVRSGSFANRIGGTSISERNLISGNNGNGIVISGVGSEANTIAGNYVGLDSSGFFAVGNHTAGIRVCDGARRNQIGFDSAGISSRLIVAGSQSNGIEIVGIGTDSNVVDWAYVGLDGRGDGDRPNGLSTGQGVLIGQGARCNYIGGEEPQPRNVISGNYGPGINISGYGTNQNVVVGNYIGVYRLGTSPQGNSAGVVIRDSAQHNFIGTATSGNLISGNRGDLFPLGAGVVIFGDATSFNTVQRNLIGCDYTGTRAIRNRSAGIVIGGGASDNLIGGDSTVGNQISGNGTLPFSSGLGSGIHVFGHGTNGNIVAGNMIGVAADKTSALANNGHGIGIFGGATNTTVGGPDLDARNVIAKNKHTGVWVEGPYTTGHVIRFNAMFNNDSGGIAMNADANQSVQPPTILGLTIDSVWGVCPAGNAMVDLYRARSNTTGKIHGIAHLTETVTRPDGTFACPPTGLSSGDSVTAVLTIEGVGSSSFSVSAPMPAPSDTTGSNDGDAHQLTLHQNMPNPFNNNTIISYILGGKNHVSIEIFNLAGQRVQLLHESDKPAGYHSVVWDGTNSDGRLVASGAYFYRLTVGTDRLTRKMILLK